MTSNGRPPSEPPFVLEYAGSRRTNLEIGDCLGAGAYSEVVKVRDSRTNKSFAMKRVRIVPNSRCMNRKAVYERVQEEINVMRKLSGPHVVSFEDAFADPNSFCILMSPIADCDLEQYYGVCAKAEFSESVLRPIREWFSCLTAGLQYIHAQHIRHKDIKPENVLVKQGRVLYADFGIAKDFQYGAITSTTEGFTFKTPRYAAPEAHNYEGRRTYSADVFSLGCIFAELATLLSHRSVKEFEDERMTTNHSSAYWNALDMVRSWLLQGSEDLYRIIAPTLYFNAADRPSARQLHQNFVEASLPEFKMCCHMTNMVVSANDDNESLSDWQTFSPTPSTSTSDLQSNPSGQGFDGDHSGQHRNTNASGREHSKMMVLSSNEADAALHQADAESDAGTMLSISFKPSHEPAIQVHTNAHHRSKGQQFLHASVGKVGGAAKDVKKGVDHVFNTNAPKLKDAVQTNVPKVTNAVKTKVARVEGMVKSNAPKVKDVVVHNALRTKKTFVEKRVVLAQKLKKG